LILSVVGLDSRAFGNTSTTYNDLIFERQQTGVNRGVAGMELEAMINPNYQETTYFFEYVNSEALSASYSATEIGNEAMRSGRIVSTKRGR